MRSAPPAGHDEPVTTDPTPTMPSPGDAENLLADIADDLHTARVHRGNACHGDNDDCQGGPDRPDLEAADLLFNRVAATFGLRPHELLRDAS